MRRSQELKAMNKKIYENSVKFWKKNPIQCKIENAIARSNYFKALNQGRYRYDKEKRM